MSEIIEEFWIFSAEGELLIHFQKALSGGNQFNYDLPELDKKSLKEMQELIMANSKNPTSNQSLLKYNNLKYNFAQCLKNDSVIFYKTIESVKEKKIKKVCETVSRIFEESYKSYQLKSIESNLDVFDKFKKKLNLHFKLSNL